jgi:hypothetical protein
MAMTQVQVCKIFIDDVLIDGGSRVNIITKNLRIQLSLSKPNLMFYSLRMVDQTIAKPLGLLRDLKIFVHGIPCMVTFIVINIIILNYNYSMLLGHSWLKDEKVSHDQGINIVTIQGTSTIRTIHVTKKLCAQTKRPQILVCYYFHYEISDEEEDVMFGIKLNLFSIGTITIPTHTKHVHKPICIPSIVIAKLVQN